MAAARMHSDETPTDAALVRRLVATQFPEWADLAVEPVASFGTDNALYRIGDDMVARLPRREVDVGLRDVGAREVSDRHAVLAAEGVEVLELDAIQIHRDAARLAEEGDPVPVGTDVHRLVGGRLLGTGRLGSGRFGGRLAGGLARSFGYGAHGNVGIRSVRCG